MFSADADVSPLPNANWKKFAGFFVGVEGEADVVEEVVDVVVVEEEEEVEGAGLGVAFEEVGISIVYSASSEMASSS